MEASEKDRDGASGAGAEDGLIENYRTILNELSLLTTVSVLLFGFLLTSSNSFGDSTLEEILYSIAIVLVATATLVFVLPVAYHHLQYPYHNFEKFTHRVHAWTLLGLPLLGASMYLSLSLAIWSLLGAWALGIAVLPLMAIAVVFMVRRELSDGVRDSGAQLP